MARNSTRKHVKLRRKSHRPAARRPAAAASPPAVGIACRSRAYGQCNADTSHALKAHARPPTAECDAMQRRSTESTSAHRGHRGHTAHSGSVALLHAPAVRSALQCHRTLARALPAVPSRSAQTPLPVGECSRVRSAVASPDRAVAPLPSQGVPELAAERAKADVLLRALGADTSSLQAELGHWSPWQVK